MNDILVNGEKIIWEGRAKNCGLTDAPFKGPLMARWIIWILIGVALSVFYTVATFGDGFAWGLLIFTIGVPLFFIIQPISDRKVILNKSMYAITNRRVICYADDTKIWSLPLEAAAKYRINTLSNGTAVVFMGTASTAKLTAARKIAIMGLHDSENTKVEGIAFYGIEDYEAVRKILANGGKAN